ncbi:hypothetical protein CEXT_489831 [Caerostris extrusa]|uniref:Uncharacterized protein n=1 Tax=Caerostris extrusa TaxID=172846 RepID=A0AAV4N9Y3_CAEEX|nr:hypothetical protein CEXT_489831 [Caerostris extrusa]
MHSEFAVFFYASRIPQIASNITAYCVTELRENARIDSALYAFVCKTGLDTAQEYLSMTICDRNVFGLLRSVLKRKHFYCKVYYFLVFSKQERKRKETCIVICFTSIQKSYYVPLFF